MTTMDLRIITPLAVLVDSPARSLQAVDDSGSFGILPHHVDFITRLSVSVVTWVAGDGSAYFCALRGGALTVENGKVAIASREAVIGDNLDNLDRDVLVRFHQDIDDERFEYIEANRRQLDVTRQLADRLRSKGGGHDRP